MSEIIKKNGIRFGLILGLFSVAITTIIYVVDLELFTKPWIGIVSIIVSIIIGVTLVSQTKKQLNGQISFKEAFSVYFLAAVIGGVISTLYNYILFNFIDPEAKERIQEIITKYTVDLMEKIGASQEQLNETVQKLAETDNYSIGNLFMGYAFSLIFSAIFGLILAAIFKSKSHQGL